MHSIVELEAMAGGLPEEERRLFDDIFEVCTFTGALEIPDTFKGKAWEYIAARDEKGRITEPPKSVFERLMKQTVVRTRNKWTNEADIFNALRATRPGMRPEDIRNERVKVDQHVAEARKGCDLCYPEQYTSQDTFGRVEGKHCITGANMAKFDAIHGMTYFREHHPLVFSEEQFHDYLETSFRWFVEAHNENPDANYPFFLWNCLEKAAASQVHGHTQSLLGRKRHYAKVAALNDASQRYNKSWQERSRGAGDYFKDLFNVHSSLGLAIENGDANVFAYITPVKEKETIIVAPYTDMRYADGRKYLRDSIYRTLRCFIDKLGVHSFNVTILMPPMEPEDGWEHFPYVARVVDRGSILKATADIGGCELYGETVVATDPYSVIETLRAYF